MAAPPAAGAESAGIRDAAPSPVAPARAAIVGILSNAASGHNREQFPNLRRRIGASPAIRHIVTASINDIPAALARFKDAGVGLLAINGGDGTAAAVLGQLLEGGQFTEPPVIALLPGGTANMTAGDVGMRGPLAKAVARFCKWCDRGVRIPPAALHRRRLLRLQPIPDGRSPSDERPSPSRHPSSPSLSQTSPPPQPRPQQHSQPRSQSRQSATEAAACRYGMFLGGGAVMQGTEYAHRKIHARGLRDDFSLALGTARTLWGVHRGDPAFNRSLPIEIAIDSGEPRRHAARILAVSTLARLAFGMRPFWGRGPGRLRITIMEHGCTRFIRTFAGIARGKPGRNAVPESGYFSCNADGLRLKADGPLNLDGEVFEPDGAIAIDATRPLSFLRL